MNKQRKNLTLNRETLRDLTAQNAGDVKAGAKKPPTAKCTRKCDGGSGVHCTAKCDGSWDGCW